jgi:hypothetical protein
MAGSELTSSIDEEYLEAHLVFFERSKELFGDAGLDPESGLFDDSMLEGFEEHTRVLLRRGSFKLVAQSTDRLLETCGYSGEHAACSVPSICLLNAQAHQAIGTASHLVQAQVAYHHILEFPKWRECTLEEDLVDIQHQLLQINTALQMMSTDAAYHSTASEGSGPITVCTNQDILIAEAGRRLLGSVLFGDGR